MQPNTEREEQESLTNNGASRLWLGLIAAVAAIAVLSIIYAFGSSSNGARVRGPADEAAPGAQPARDIDRSRSP